MIRNAMLTVAFSACVLSAATLCAQEAEGEAKPLRFEAMVRVLNLEAQADATGATMPGAGLRVTLPNGKTVDAVSYKAYPYGSTFEATAGTQFRICFSPLTYAVVKGPAKFVPTAAEEWQKVQMKIDFGDVNTRVDDRALAGQFELVTPLGTFTDMNGMAKLHVGQDVALDKPVKGDDFSFRTLSGSAAFKGLHYTMNDMTQANAFSSTDAMGFSTSELTGRLGEVKMAIPSGNGASTDFSLTPGSQVKITRAKPQGSDNWVVSVLTLYANGEAKNYFCYVENRGEGYSTGELIDEILPAEEEGELAEGEEGSLEDEGSLGGEDFDASAYGDIPDELNDFGDGALL